MCDFLPPGSSLQKVRSGFACAKPLRFQILTVLAWLRNVLLDWYLDTAHTYAATVLSETVANAAHPFSELLSIPFSSHVLFLALML